MKVHQFKDAFDQRAAGFDVERISQYNHASAAYPAARETERRLLIDLLDVHHGQRICDITAGGGYLADGIHARLGGQCHICCVENSAHFSQSLPDRYERVHCSLSEITIESSSIDRVACLAGLHHQEDKQQFFNEAFRILRDGGKIGVGDVLSGSAPAQFLNIEVDRWSDLGHDGLFFEPGELTHLMQTAGFIDVIEQVHHYTWDLPNHAELIWFCKILFGMTKAELSDVEASINRYVPAERTTGIARMTWCLVYAGGRKP